MFFADLHCDFLSKAAQGASFEKPESGQAISRAAVEGGGLRLLGMAAFCGDSQMLSREEMAASVKAQFEAYEAVTEQPERRSVSCGNAGSRAFNAGGFGLFAEHAGA